VLLTREPERKLSNGWLVGVSESLLGGNCSVVVGGGEVCGSSSWEVERRCLVRNPRPPPTLPRETVFEGVDPRLQNNIGTLTATAMIISNSRRDCGW